MKGLFVVNGEEVVVNLVKTKLCVALTLAFALMEQSQRQLFCLVSAHSLNAAFTCQLKSFSVLL